MKRECYYAADEIHEEGYDPKSTLNDRLNIAKRIYAAMSGRFPDRQITLCDADGRIVAGREP